jgi:hypothetical protein
MAGHPDLPKKVSEFLLWKSDIFNSLKKIDNDSKERNCILKMGLDFRKKIEVSTKELPDAKSNSVIFYTYPFAPLFYS